MAKEGKITITNMVYGLGADDVFWKKNVVNTMKSLVYINFFFIIYGLLTGDLNHYNQLFQREKKLVDRLEKKSYEMQMAKEQYQTDIQLIANKRLYPGVVVKLNNRIWRADREYDTAKIRYLGYQWHVEPLK